MFPSSLVVIVTGLFLGALAISVFAWAWRRGHFDQLHAQAHVIFDERDYRLERPWESAEELETREDEHGVLIEPEPGEWGGAS